MRIKNSFWLPAIFSVYYVYLAVVLPSYLWLSHPPIWRWTYWIYSLPAGAVAIILTFWIYAIFWARRADRTGTGFLLLMTGRTIAVLGANIKLQSYSSHSRADRLDGRLRGRLLGTSVTDEELISKDGNPVGIRLRYRIRYPPRAFPIGPSDPSPNPLAGYDFQIKSSSRSFTLSHNHAKFLGDGTYEMVDDLVPSFDPKFMIWPDNNDFCFDWPKDAPHTGPPALGIDSPPERFQVISAYLRYEGPTQHLYSLRRFYDGAIKEGAKECGR